MSITSPRRILAQQRREEAVRLRVENRWSSRRIAAHLGISHTAVLKHLRASLEETSKTIAESVERMRIEETLALDAMQESVWPQAVQQVDLLMPKDDELPKTARGNVDMRALVEMIQTGTDNRINAINTILRISKRRAMLHGLDMPQRRVIEGGIVVEHNVRHTLMERFESIRTRKLAAPDPAPGPVIDIEPVE